MRQGAAVSSQLQQQQQHQELRQSIAPPTTHSQASSHHAPPQPEVPHPQFNTGMPNLGGVETGTMTPMGMAGSRIDAELKRMDDMNQAVLSASDTSSLSDSNEWSIPDLALIFRPPKSVMENMAVSIRPGQWAKLAPSVTPRRLHLPVHVVRSDEPRP
jgi:hypothetical protein